MKAINDSATEWIFKRSGYPNEKMILLKDNYKFGCWDNPLWVFIRN